LNLTVVSNVTLYQTRIDNVSMWKGCAYANASRNAMFYVQMAARGVTGPSPVFEGRGGYFVAVTRMPFELGPFGGRGQPFKIMDCLIKRYPMGQYAQSVAQAALEARALVKDVRDIAEVHVRTLYTAIEMMAGDPDKWKPHNRETADHSMPYTAGVALKYGSLDVKYFNDPYLHDPELLDLVGRIKCSVSEEANSREPEAMLCDLDVVTKDGKRESSRVEYHRGHPKNPMADAEIEEKFRSLAGDQMPAAQVDKLLKQLWSLDSLTDIRDLIALTRISKNS
jgi:2-methylcitrate dehydratase